MKTVTCVVSAFNEATRIKATLEVVVGHKNIFEVIVVDDGSKDATNEIAKSFPIRLITLAKNSGKSNALACGIEAATGDFLFLLDADLINLTKDHITQLLTPILECMADVSMSLRMNDHGFWRVIGINLILRIIGIDFLSGERVLPRDIVSPYLDTLKKLPCYGVEVYS